MAVGFGMAFIGLVSLLTVLGTIAWLWRSLCAGEIGLIGGGTGPVVRRVRQPLKFWIAVGAVTSCITLPAAAVAYVLIRQIVIGLSE